jgi:two-component system NtrC family sensor kinase
MSRPILVVDDSLTIRMDLLEILEAAGMPAEACANLHEARQALARQHFALVILDVLLPDGNGVELLEEIRAAPETEATAVLLLSSEAEIRDRIRGLTRGADDYVGKPYDQAYLVARARELAGASATDERQCILVIDDSLTFRETLRSALEEAGYQVITAGTGEEGLRLAADRRPAAAIVDGILPGIDGATVIRRIRLDAALRRLPCLLLTALEERDAEVRALEAGADAFVRKDEEIAVVLARLSAMLRSAGSAGAGPEAASLRGSIACCSIS